MFTGIIREKGIIGGISRQKSGTKLSVICSRIKEGLKKGDSVSVNGVCLTVSAMDNCVRFDVVANTLETTTLKRLRKGDAVNLENALKAGDDMSGHIVSGHVDCERQIRKNTDTAKGWVLDIKLSAADKKFIVPKGSVAIDGVSLTVGEVRENIMRIYLIPLTLEETTLKLKRTGDYVNVEFDPVARYAVKNTGAGISENMLRVKGFI